MKEDLAGKIGICSRGRLGLIEGRKELPWGESWIGKGLDDGTEWASRDPKIVFDSLAEYEKDRHVLGIGPEYNNPDYERWTMDQAFMSNAYIMARCSHDSDTQHGAVIVNERRHPIAGGCNGWLPKSPDASMPNTRKDGFKYAHVRHAERNALDQAEGTDLSGCTVYVTGIPCNDCLGDMIAKGIRTIVYGDVDHEKPEGFWEMHNFLVKTHGVTIRKFEGEVVDTSKTREISDKEV